MFLYFKAVHNKPYLLTNRAFVEIERELFLLLNIAADAYEEKGLDTFLKSIVAREKYYAYLLPRPRSNFCLKFCTSANAYMPIFAEIKNAIYPQRVSWIKDCSSYILPTHPKTISTSQKKNENAAESNLWNR